MARLIASLRHAVPKALPEVITRGRTLKKRSAYVLAYFYRPGTSNGPTEAINGRLEHLRGSALGFRNLTNYIARSLLEAGGFRPRLHPQLGRARQPPPSVAGRPWAARHNRPTRHRTRPGMIGRAASRDRVGTAGEIW